jgi:hypothetical protein
MRRLVPIMLAAVLLAALATPAAANPTGRGATDTPLGTYDVLIPAADGCPGFDVLVEDIAGSIKDIDLGIDGQGNERFITQFRTVTRYSRLDSVTGEPTGPSFTRPFHSHARYTFAPDGSLTVQWSKGLLAWAPEVQAMGLADGIWLIENGSGTIMYGLSSTEAKLNGGRLFDVCAALS